MRFVVIGAGGFSREVADMLDLLDHEIVAFVDDAPVTDVHDPTGKPIVSSIQGLAFDAAVIAIGDSGFREKYLALQDSGVSLPAVIHPSACVSPSATLGHGVLVMNNVVINAQAKVGAGAIINVAACVAHDCVVGACSHLAPGVCLGGGARVGDRCMCGTNAVLLPGVAVGDDATCGAGAVITADVESGATVVGVPARPLSGDFVL